MKRRAAVAAVILGLCTPALADDNLDGAGDDLLYLAIGHPRGGSLRAHTAHTFQAFISQNAPDSGPWNKALYIRSPGGAGSRYSAWATFSPERGMSVVAFDLCASACTYMLMVTTRRHA